MHALRLSLCLPACNPRVVSDTWPRLFLANRSPDTARIKSKMLYASSKEAIKKVLMGVGIHLTATDASELAKESIEDGVSKFL